MRERGNPRLRFLDRYLGVPLLAVGGLLKRRRERPERVRTIGLLRPTSIGDMVLLSGVIRDLSESIPGARVIVFGGADNAAVAALIPGVTEVVTLPLTRPWISLPRLRQRRLDALLDCGPWSRIEALYAALSGARFTVGFSRKGQSRHDCYDVVVPHTDDLHEVDHYRRLAEELGVSSRSEPSVPAPGVLSKDELPDRPYVVFHLWPSGYRSDLKEWPEERWRRLAVAVSARWLTHRADRKLRRRVPVGGVRRPVPGARSPHGEHRRSARAAPGARPALRQRLRRERQHRHHAPRRGGRRSDGLPQRADERCAIGGRCAIQPSRSTRAWKDAAT